LSSELHPGPTEGGEATKGGGRMRRLVLSLGPRRIFYKSGDVAGGGDTRAVSV